MARTQESSRLALVWTRTTMNITIEYCGAWNYLPRATSLAAKIKEELGVDAEVIQGSGGIYDIKVDDTMVYSKHANGNQFPESDDAVVDLIRSAT